MNLEQIKKESFVKEFNKIAATVEDAVIGPLNRTFGWFIQSNDDYRQRRKVRRAYRKYLAEGNPTMSIDDFLQREQNIAKRSRLEKLQKTYDTWSNQTGNVMALDDFDKKLRMGEIHVNPSKAGKFVNFVKNHKVGLTLGALGLGAGAVLLSGAKKDPISTMPEYQEIPTDPNQPMVV